MIGVTSFAAMGRARERVRWGAKARGVLEVYRWVVEKGEKPNFAMPMPDLDD